jgi:hypothetical protein
VIAGRSVSFVKGPGGTNAYAARWKTSAALYLALGNGTPEPMFRRLVGCMP